MTQGGREMEEGAEGKGDVESQRVEEGGGRNWRRVRMEERARE